MINLLRCEFLKTRRRWIFVTALVLVAMQTAWGLHGNYNDFSIANGWMMFLYQLPLVNAIFLPILAIVVASRLCDVEHKGVMLKQLATVSRRGRIYDAKLLYGLAIMAVCVLINWGITIAFGYYKGFAGDVPMDLYLLHLAFTFVPTMSIFIFQYILALLCKNQAITFFAGVIGTFGGLFSMFLPQLPWLRKLLLWGHYGALQMVGMFGWTKETRYDNAYFEVMGIDWQFCLVALGLCLIMYIIGRQIFVRKDL